MFLNHVVQRLAYGLVRGGAKVLGIFELIIIYYI